MANNLRLFNTNSEYQSADLILPAVSYVVEIDKVIYDYTPPTPPVFQGKWKATYSDSHVESAQCGSSSEIVRDEIELAGLASVEIGNCVTSIVDYAFQYCNSLTTCTIGSGVTSIDTNAFWGCSGLTSVVIPDNVTSIGENVFRVCYGLTSCTIGSGVTSIGGRVFLNCSSLTSVIVNVSTPPTLGVNAFNNTNNCPIYVPSASVDAYKSAWSQYASRIFSIP